MDKETNLLSMLNHSSIVVGLRQVLRGISEDTLRCVIVSEDADGELRNKIVAAASEKDLQILTAPSMAWLGREVNIKVGASTVGINKL